MKMLKRTALVMGLVLLTGCGTSSETKKSEWEKPETEITEETEEKKETEETVFEEIKAEPLNNAVTEEVEKALDAFSIKLLELKENTRVKYELMDIDGNGIPEMLTAEDSYHVATVTVYAFDGEELVYVGDFGQYGQCGFYDGQGIIEAFYDVMGGVNIESYMAFDKADVKILAEFERTPENSEKGVVTRLDTQEVITSDEVSKILGNLLPSDGSYMVTYDMMPFYAGDTQGIEFWRESTYDSQRINLGLILNREYSPENGSDIIMYMGRNHAGQAWAEFCNSYGDALWTGISPMHYGLEPYGESGWTAVLEGYGGFDGEKIEVTWKSKDSIKRVTVKGIGITTAVDGDYYRA